LHAVHALASVPPQSAVAADFQTAAVVERALNDPDPGVRARAAESLVYATEGPRVLGRPGKPHVREALLRTALTDSDLTVRIKALEQLGNHGSEQELRVLQGEVAFATPPSIASAMGDAIRILERHLAKNE